MLEQCITPNFYFDDKDKVMFSQAYTFSAKQFDVKDEERWYPELVECVSNIDEGTYYITGKQLKNIIIRSYMGDLARISMEYDSAADNNYDLEYISAGDSMDKKKEQRKMSAKLKETIVKQAYKVQKAKELKKTPIPNVGIDEDLARDLFDTEPE